MMTGRFSDADPSLGTGDGFVNFLSVRARAVQPSESTFRRSSAVQCLEVAGVLTWPRPQGDPGSRSFVTYRQLRADASAVSKGMMRSGAVAKVVADFGGAAHLPVGSEDSCLGAPCGLDATSVYDAGAHLACERRGIDARGASLDRLPLTKAAQ